MAGAMESTRIVDMRLYCSTDACTQQSLHSLLLLPHILPSAHPQPRHTADSHSHFEGHPDARRFERVSKQINNTQAILVRILLLYCVKTSDCLSSVIITTPGMLDILLTLYAAPKVATCRVGGGCSRMLD